MSDDWSKIFQAGANQVETIKAAPKRDISFVANGQPAGRSALDSYLDLCEMAFIDEDGTDMWPLEAYRMGVNAGRDRSIDIDDHLRVLLERIASVSKAQDVAHSRAAYLRGVRVGRRAQTLAPVVMSNLARVCKR